MQLVMQLVRQGDRWRHKVLQLGRPWIVVGHRLQRLEPRRLRWLVQEVRVLWRRSWQQARLQVQRWRLMEDRLRRRVVRRVQRQGAQVLRRSRRLASQVRLREQPRCRREAASRMRWLQLAKRLMMLVGRLRLRQMRRRRRSRKPTAGILGTTRAT